MKKTLMTITRRLSSKNSKLKDFETQNISRQRQSNSSMNQPRTFIEEKPKISIEFLINGLEKKSHQKIPDNESSNQTSFYFEPIGENINSLVNIKNQTAYFAKLNLIFDYIASLQRHFPNSKEPSLRLAMLFDFIEKNNFRISLPHLASYFLQNLNNFQPKNNQKFCEVEMKIMSMRSNYEENLRNLFNSSGDICSFSEIFLTLVASRLQKEIANGKYSKELPRSVLNFFFDELHEISKLQIPYFENLRENFADSVKANLNSFSKNQKESFKTIEDAIRNLHQLCSLSIGSTNYVFDFNKHLMVLKNNLNMMNIKQTNEVISMIISRILLEDEESMYISLFIKELSCNIDSVLDNTANGDELEAQIPIFFQNLKTLKDIFPFFASNVKETDIFLLLMNRVSPKTLNITFSIDNFENISSNLSNDFFTKQEFVRFIENADLAKLSSDIRIFIFHLYFRHMKVNSLIFEKKLSNYFTEHWNLTSVFETFFFILLSYESNYIRSSEIANIDALNRIKLKNPLSFQTLIPKSMSKGQILDCYRKIKIFQRKHSDLIKKNREVYFNTKSLERTFYYFSQLLTTHIFENVVVPIIYENKFTENNSKSLEGENGQRIETYTRSEVEELIVDHSKLLQKFSNTYSSRFHFDFVQFFLTTLDKICSPTSSVKIANYIFNSPLEKNAEVLISNYILDRMKFTISSITQSKETNSDFDIKYFSNFLKFNNKELDFSSIISFIQNELTSDLFKNDIQSSLNLIFILLMTSKGNIPQFQNFFDYLMNNRSLILNQLKKDFFSLNDIRNIFYALIVPLNRKWVSANQKELICFIDDIRDLISSNRIISSQESKDKKFNLSYIQMIFLDFLRKEKIENQPEKFVEIFRVDFFIRPNIVIEINGQVHFKRDQKDQFSILKKEILEFFGYVVVELTDEEINSMKILESKIKEIKRLVTIHSRS